MQGERDRAPRHWLDPLDNRRVRTLVPHKRGIHYSGLPGHPRRFEHLSSSANGSIDRIPVQKARLALAYSRATLVKESLLFLGDFHAIKALSEILPDRLHHPDLFVHRQRL